MYGLYHDLMSSDPKVLATVVAVFGTFVAAALASFGYLYRMRVEQKKSLRKVLYFLLEIRNSVLAKLFDPEAAAQQYFEHMAGHFKIRGLNVEMEIPDEMRRMIVDHFRNLMSLQCTDIEARLLTPFQDALLDMATINPTVAYRLYGKEKVTDLIGHTRRYESEWTRMLDQNVPEVVGRTMRDTSAKIMNNAAQELSGLLDDDIRLLAKACGLRDYLQCKRILKQDLVERSRMDFSGLDSVFDELIADLVASAVAQNAVNQSVHT